MSRGFGVAQRRILSALETDRAVYLVHLAANTVEYKSLYRAACRLNDADKIGMLICQFGMRKVILHRLDFDIGAVSLSELRQALDIHHKRRQAEQPPTERG